MNDTLPLDRKPLTRAIVIEHALALADADGLDAVTIRRLAKELGVTPMALYWHFRNKDELLDGMVDRIYATFDGTIDGSAPWPAQFRALLNQLIVVFRAHPAAATLLQTRETYSESSLRVNETALDILHRAGLTPFEATRAMRHAVAMTVAVASDAAALAGRAPAAPKGNAEHDAASAFPAQPAQRYPVEATRVIQDQDDAESDADGVIAAESAQRYPRIVEAAATMREHDDPDAYCAFGVDLIVSGVEVIAARGRGRNR
jgi:AcrR family transcriptional regulator